MIEKKLLLLLLLPALCRSICWEPGRNPDFSAAPAVTQVAVDRVRVSWVGLVTKEACVDNYVVKYWQRLFPRDYFVTRVVPRGRYAVDIDVVPYLIYHFQAVAREEQGPVMGVDWNRSPVAAFQTSQDGHGVHVPLDTHPFARYDDGGYLHEDYFDEVESVEVAPSPLSGPQSRILGHSPELFVVYASLAAGLALVAVGCGFKLYSALVHGDDEDDDDEHHDKSSLKSDADDKTTTATTSATQPDASDKQLQALLAKVEEGEEEGDKSAGNESALEVLIPTQKDD